MSSGQAAELGSIVTTTAQLALLLIFAGLVGCAEGPGGALTLSWLFADGRSCQAAGVVDVVIRGASAAASPYRCPDGWAPATVEVQVDDVPRTLVIEGRSISDALLYEGRQEVEELGDTRVSLRFVGGRR